MEADDALARFEKSWAKAVNEVAGVPGVIEHRKRAKGYFGSTLEVIHRSRTKANSVALFREGTRITSVAVRRFAGLLAACDALSIEGVTDQTRGLVELTFQAFYLLRSADAHKAALDAYNLSAKSWSRAGDRLVEKGHLSDSDFPKDHPTREKVQREVFSKYEDARPRFYGSMTAEETASAAGLQRVYDMIYSVLSRGTHNEPFAEPGAELVQRKDEGFELSRMAPDPKAVNSLFSLFGVGVQAGVLAALGGLALIAMPEVSRASDFLREFRAKHPLDWASSLDLLEKLWEIGSVPPGSAKGEGA